MAGNDLHISYSAADFERYYNNSMPVAERHELEKAALEDPFLADALEGYALASNSTKESADLNNRLAMRVQKKNTGPLLFGNFTRLRIAAMVILLAGLGWLVLKMATNNKNELAKTDATKSAVTKNDSVVKTPELQNAEQDNKDVAIANKKRPNGKKGKTNTEFVKQKDIPSPLQAGAPIDNTPSFARSTADTITLMNTRSVTMQKRVSAPQQEANKEVVTNTFKGRVLDENNTPLPNVSILAKDQNKGTTTDQNGEFTLSIPDTAVNVVASSVGFSENKKRLSNGTENEIILKPSSNALSEVIIVNDGKRFEAKAKKEERVNIQNGIPVVGIDSFTTYLLNGIKNFKGNNVKEKNGSVSLSFIINEKGEAQEIKVRQSLSKKSDAAAKQLIEDGPKWNSMDKKKEIFITILFQ